MKPLLRASELCAGYGAGDILHGVSFALERDKVCALLGENGSGKTTLLRAVCGLLRATCGLLRYRFASPICTPGTAQISA